MFNLKRTIMVLLIAMFSMLVGMNQAMADRPAKVDVCHWQVDNGAWKLISIGQNAAADHLADITHDDGLPDAATTQTGTELDENCEATYCGNCIVAHSEPGCENVECEGTVAALDPFCVDVAWDGICVEEALEACVGGGICTP